MRLTSQVLPRCQPNVMPPASSGWHEHGEQTHFLACPCSAFPFCFSVSWCPLLSMLCSFLFFCLGSCFSCSFVRSFVRLFVCLFVRLFVCLIASCLGRSLACSLACLLCLVVCLFSWSRESFMFFCFAVLLLVCPCLLLCLSLIVWFMEPFVRFPSVPYWLKAAFLPLFA